ncbi:MAG: LacI family transcriptional regulator [Flavobacteriales bacterium]|nr:MAG: LacI family transcriptional regulator [Flavobacteriales bacterium]PIE49650.1 MAG: LacI family transcriptional regulator [Flavobacteriales bacterium]
MKKKITLKDIANEFEVSVSTVSRALKDSHEISEEVRERIQAFAKYYNYKPNTFALKFRNKKTMVLGVIIPEIVHHFFSEVIEGIEKIANKNDYNLMICLSNESYEKEKLNVEMMAEGQVDGVLVSIAKGTLKRADYQHFKSLQNDGIPIVFFDRATDQIDCDSVVVDDYDAGYHAAMHLYNQGCERIGIIGTPDFVNVGALRMAGYRKALTELQGTVPEELILEVDESIDLEQQVSEYLDNLTQWPDGIVAVNEIYAAVVIQLAKKHRVDIPKDLAIIGFTNGLISRFSSPQLSTVVQYGTKIGEQAAELILHRIAETGPVRLRNRNIVIKTTIQVRESSDRSGRFS